MNIHWFGQNAGQQVGETSITTGKHNPESTHRPGGDRMRSPWEARLRSAVLIVATLPALLSFSGSACSAPAQPMMSSTAERSQAWKVSGGRLEITGATRLCLTVALTLRPDQLEPVGRNSASHDGLMGSIGGWLQLALRRHGQVNHLPQDVTSPRIVRGGDCGRNDVRLHARLSAREDGTAYRFVLLAEQSDRQFTAEVERAGFADIAPGTPVLPGERTTDGRPYWDIARDIEFALQAFESRVDWR